MIRYLRQGYKAWCSSRTEEQIKANGEEFIKIMHVLNGFDKKEMRLELADKKWFKSDLK